MNLLNYLRLLRPGRLWLLLGGALCLAVALGAQFGGGVAGQPSVRTFLVLVVLTPLVAGLILSGVIHALLHRPFAIILPGLRRQVIVWHALTVTGVATLSALLAPLRDPGVPPAVVFCLAAAAFSLSLPLEPGGRWFGSRLLGALVATALLFGLINVHDLRSAIIAAPRSAGLLGLVTVAVCFALGFSRDRRRVRALQPLTTIVEAFGQHATLARMEKERLARSSRIGRRWRHGKVGGSVRDWVRVAWHERFAKSRLGWSGFVLLCFLYWVAYDTWVFRQKSVPENIAASVYRILCEPAQARAGNSLLLLLVLFGSVSVPFLRPTYLYPISRARRARTAYWSSATFSLLLIASISILALGTAWIAAGIADLDFRPNGMVSHAAIIMITLPLIPLLQWAGFYAQVRRDQAIGNLILLAGALSGITVSMGFSGLLQTHRDTLLSPVGLTVCALAIAASQWGYAAALRRFYRRGDLLQRGTSKQGLGLV